MTIAVAVRTAHAVVFAADSKLTTRGLAGLAEDGSPHWVEQTYDSATKVVRDQRGHLMAMVAGAANVGRVSATDFIQMQDLPAATTVAEQDQHIDAMLKSMCEEKAKFWKETEVPPEEWPGPALVLAATSPDQHVPRVWHVTMEGEHYSQREILSSPGVWLEGSYREVFSLLYGFRDDVVTGISAALAVDQTAVMDAMQNGTLRPIDRLHCHAMPVQDAIDLAVFLATVQIQMDRFLPGTPACGGPIDVMLLKTLPTPGISMYPGKAIHHPAVRS